ncbi:MAG: VWA domain-containing protein [Thermoleophilia bacterium]|nr:VWA domain-containing protein [Thermoleophilia bacterium]
MSRQDPGCIIFLIDQSGSMEEPMGGSDYPKCVQVARLINDLLREIGLRCKKEDGVRDYFHVGVIGYSGSSASSALQFLDRTELLDGSELLAELILPISRIADNPVRVEELSELASDGRGGHFVQKVIRPVWLEPKAEGRTPMCEALRLAYRAVSQWIKLHRNSFPPIVINITDGTSTDGDPQEIANDLRSLRTSDGAALLFNIHISRSVAHRPILFPSSDEHLPGPPAKKLFAMSSILPESMRRAASQLGYSVDERSRGFAFNGDLTAVIHFLDIGTQATRLV